MYIMHQCWRSSALGVRGLVGYLNRVRTG